MEKWAKEERARLDAKYGKAPLKELPRSGKVDAACFPIPQQFGAVLTQGQKKFPPQRRATDTKPTNPKDACGIKKAPISTVSGAFMMAVGAAMLEGGLKYGRHNYRRVGVRASVYVDALVRHMISYWEGEDIDPDSGVHHVIKAAACAAVLYDAIVTGKFTDDRPPKLPKGWLEELNKKAGALVEKYPNPKPAITDLDVCRHGVRGADCKRCGS